MAASPSTSSSAEGTRGQTPAGVRPAVLTAASPSARITVTGTGALGEPLGPVISLTDQAQTQPLPEFAAQASAAKASVPISPGTQQLSVSVTVVFAA